MAQDPEEPSPNPQGQQPLGDPHEGGAISQPTAYPEEYANISGQTTANSDAQDRSLATESHQSTEDHVSPAEERLETAAENVSETSASGDIGYQAVTSGDLPDGNGGASGTDTAAGLGSESSAIPVGESPAAAVGSSAPPRRRPRSEPEEEEGDGEGGPVKSFLEHLEDLRWTIIKAGASLIVTMVICLVAAKQLVQLMTWPMKKAGLPTSLVPLDPIGPFFITLKMAFYAGMVLGLPFILYFIGEFVVPALKAKEKKFFFVAFSIGTGFFLLGVVFCYFVLLPFSLNALVSYSKWLGFSTDIWRAESYFEFAVKFLLGVGFLFEVPVLLLTLIRLEIIKHEFLVKGRSYMFVINFALCAVMTPADLLTTFVMAFCLQLIYEACILVSKYWQRQKRQKLEAEAGLRTGSDQPTSLD
ncbi:MAG: twin-arginine translocase subunit TatC [Verrucomicrobia bacterium]|nr:twin-arginine translocase subunit TatC [Verrucomicrobiota bacterium]